MKHLATDVCDQETLGKTDVGDQEIFYKNGKVIRKDLAKTDAADQT